MDKIIKDLDKKITKAESITGNLFDDLKEIRNSFSKLKEAIDVIRCCTELPNKALKDSQLSDMVSGYKMMCKPDANFEKYYSKGFTECWEWLKRITK